MKSKRKNPARCKAFPYRIACMVALMMVCSVTNAQNGQEVSLTLSQAIDLAMKQNKTLRIASLSVTDAEHKKEIARSAYFPHIANQSAVHHVTEIAGVDIPAGAFGIPAATGPIPGHSLFIGQGSTTSYTSGTGLEQPFTQLIKIREANRAARTDVETAHIQLTQAGNDVALQVRKLYCDLLIAQLKLQAANEEVSASEVKKRESVEAVSNGGALDVAVLESEVAALDARQASLTETLSIHDLSLSLNDLLGVPLNTVLLLDPDPTVLAIAIPSREECLRTAHQRSPAILAAQQAVLKARAGLGASKDAYIPDVTGLARYSYQSGVPLLVHNFGTFGFSFTYDLFDGGRRSAEIKQARTLLSQAQLSLDQATDDVDIQIESAYDRVEQAANMVEVSQEALDLRIEAARLADRQLEQSATLASSRAEAHAKLASARASLLGTELSLSVAQGDLKRIMGEVPR